MNEFLRCLQELDVKFARTMWARLFPHLIQPNSDEEMLLQLHLARLQSKSMTARQKRYSRRWLKERESGRVGMAVGLAVGAPPHRLKRAQAIREAMEDAVTGSLKAGIDIDTEASEVKSRILQARNKELGIGRGTTSGK